MSDEGRFVLARHGPRLGRYIVIAAPDPESPGTWLSELWEQGTPATHRGPFKPGRDCTWALVRKRLAPVDLAIDADKNCRAVRIMREICPYLRDPKRGEPVRSFQWNGRLRTLTRPRRELKAPGPAQDPGDGGGSADVDVGPGGLAALKSENQL